MKVLLDEQIDVRMKGLLTDFEVFTLLLLDTPFLLWTFQELFVPKLMDFLSNPPDPLPRIVHFSIEGLSKGSKKNALLRMVGVEQILFL